MAACPAINRWLPGNTTKIAGACVGELDASQSRFANLLQAVEVGSDVTALVQRLRDVEASVTESSSYANLSTFMEQLQSKETGLDEKLKLRFKMLAEVQRVVSKLLLFPGGRYYDEGALALEAEGLRAAGYDEGRGHAHLESLPIKPNREERYFIAFMRNGIVRTVKEGKGA